VPSGPSSSVQEPVAGGSTAQQPPSSSKRKRKAVAPAPDTAPPETPHDVRERVQREDFTIIMLVHDRRGSHLALSSGGIHVMFNDGTRGVLDEHDLDIDDSHGQRAWKQWLQVEKNPKKVTHTVLDVCPQCMKQHEIYSLTKERKNCMPPYCTNAAHSDSKDANWWGYGPWRDKGVCFCKTDRELDASPYPFSGLWIQCDTCERWIHGECDPKLPDKEDEFNKFAENVESYKCPPCVSRTGPAATNSTQSTTALNQVEPMVLEPLRDLRAEALGPTQAQLTWSAAATKGPCSLRRYELRLYKGLGDSISCAVLADVTTSHRFVDLQPGATYTFELLAHALATSSVGPVQGSPGSLRIELTMPGLKHPARIRLPPLALTPSLTRCLCTCAFAHRTCQAAAASKPAGTGPGPNSSCPGLVESNPNWTMLSGGLRAAIQAAVRRCLANVSSGT